MLSLATRTRPAYSPARSSRRSIWTNPDREAITSAAGAGDTCFAAPADQYVGEDGPRLQLGDLACFRIAIDFPDLAEVDLKTLLEAIKVADDTGKVPPLVIARAVLQAL